MDTPLMLVVYILVVAKLVEAHGVAFTGLT